MTLEGKVALVTGAARGIGRETALVLAACGADVAVLDRLDDVEATESAVCALGRGSVRVVCDVADPEQVRAAVGSVRGALGAVTVLVNNAGIVNNIAGLAQMPYEAWQLELGVNLTGAFNLIQAVIPGMVERQHGRIVNVSSIAALGGLHRQAGYAATKAGLIGLTKTVTLEYARHGITCNAVLPGLIETELVKAMPAELRESAIGVTPARRAGAMREVAALIAFLASDDAAFINGAEIAIDGGMRLNTGTLASRRELAGAARKLP